MLFTAVVVACCLLQRRRTAQLSLTHPVTAMSWPIVLCSADALKKNVLCEPDHNLVGRSRG
jgi:hypothetical protein